MPLVSISNNPGIVRETTQYSNRGGWWDGNLVRFRDGLPESIGGWKSLSDFKAIGVPRSMHDWSTLQTGGHLGIGTSSKFYILSNGQYFDVTPQRKTAVLPQDPLSVAADGSLVLTYPRHQLYQGGYVTLAANTTGFENLTADQINTEFSINNVIDNNRIQLKTTAFQGTVGDIGGGSGMTITPDLGAGPPDAYYATGFGIGGFGIGGFGQSQQASQNPLSAIVTQPRIWHQDNFGEDLIMNPRGGSIYIWHAASGIDSKATLLSANKLSSDVPQVANGIFVSVVDQNVVALGCTPYGGGDPDPMLVRWSDQQNPYVWTPRTTNVAGDYRLPSGSQIIGWLSTSGITLIWTDKSLYSMTFIGGQFIYSFNQIASDISMISPQASVNVGTAVLWMDRNGFFSYSGFISEIPCTIKSFVFDNINLLQAWKCYAFHNRSYSEAWFFYPSLNSQEIDSYVIYNYKDSNWSYGKLARTVMQYVPRIGNPIGFDPDGIIYQHEVGFDANGERNNSFIEMADLDEGDGDSFLMLTKILPDVQFLGDSTDQAIGIEVLKRNNSSDTKQIDRKLTVEQKTKQVFTRTRARRISLRYSTTRVGTGWRIGKTEALIEANGRR